MFVYLARGIETNPLLSLGAYSNVYCGFLKEAEQVVLKKKNSQPLCSMRPDKSAIASIDGTLWQYCTSKQALTPPIDSVNHYPGRGK
jgi:hypothetical protein